MVTQIRSTALHAKTVPAMVERKINSPRSLSSSTRMARSSNPLGIQSFGCHILQCRFEINLNLLQLVQCSHQSNPFLFEK
mmetsp:Transcript_17813/g.48447  ORF Transcript_17813/g.48447 Transcript_17813/m.48447 type:complete len:80 (+) Transcript_17813:295-534(+)